MERTAPLLAKAKSKMFEFDYNAGKRKMNNKDFSPKLELLLDLVLIYCIL